MINEQLKRTQNTGDRIQKKELRIKSQELGVGRRKFYTPSSRSYALRLCENVLDEKEKRVKLRCIEKEERNAIYTRFEP